jgi:hypothetical protein
MSPDEMFLDLPDRDFGQVLVDFGDDPAFHVGMKGVAQLRERARRGNYYDRFDLFSAHHVLQGGSHTLGETFLFQFMPIGRVYTAAQVCAGAFEDPSRTIGTLLMRRQIRIGQHAFGGEIRERRVAGIAQEQCPLPVADEHEGIMRDWESVHVVLQDYGKPRKAGRGSRVCEA